jgi:hypothetical protein
LFLTKLEAEKYIALLGDVEVDGGGIFESDRIVNTLYHEPCYNIAWVTITKDKEPYLLVPCKRGEERACLDRVDEILSMLNQTTPCWQE